MATEYCDSQPVGVSHRNTPSPQPLAASGVRVFELPMATTPLGLSYCSVNVLNITVNDRAVKMAPSHTISLAGIDYDSLCVSHAFKSCDRGCETMSTLTGHVLYCTLTGAVYTRIEKEFYPTNSKIYCL